MKSQNMGWLKNRMNWTSTRIDAVRSLVVAGLMGIENVALIFSCAPCIAQPNFK